MTFEEFKKVAVEAGLEARECMAGVHWQVRGKGLTVNYYPTTSRVYVNGTKGGRFIASPSQAIIAAMQPPPTLEEKVVRPKRGFKNQKKRMLGTDPHCHWCKAHLNQVTATVDHRVPLKRGGSNQPDNLVLACEGCNRWRGHDMPELA